MPELPDLVVYLEALDRTVVGHTLERIRLFSPAVLKSVEPALADAEGRRVTGTSRIGKRVVLELEGDLFLVIHLMIAGRLYWKKPGAKPPGRRGHAAFDFEHGTLMFTEASTKKRATLHCVSGRAGLSEHDRGGAEVLDLPLEDFREALQRENHTIKRSLTDPRLLSGIGNAYSDEILHRARLSPLKWTTRLTDDEILTLHEATQQTLREWIDRLRADVGSGFPEKVTAFRPEMAVHGRYREPCPVCESPVQRIVHAKNEMNYCARCQTGGKLLADRALSRLLRGDWPRTLEELEERRPSRG